MKFDLSRQVAGLKIDRSSEQAIALLPKSSCCFQSEMMAMQSGRACLHAMLKFCLDFSYIYLYEMKTAPPRSMPPECWVTLPRQESLEAADG